MRFLFALLLCSSAIADEIYVGGSTSKLLLVNMYDEAGLAKTGLAYSSVTATYMRNNGAADVDITEATMTPGTWVSGGWIEVDSTNSPGLYQFGMPDAAIADGAESVVFNFKATSTFQRKVNVILLDTDFRNGPNILANTVQIEGSDATDQINTQADAAIADYDPPTNAEMVARSLATASYATASALATAQSDITSILADTSTLDTSTKLRTLLFGSDTPGAVAFTEVTLAASQPHHELPTVEDIEAGSIAQILADTSALDTSAELRTLLTGSDTALANQSTLNDVLTDTSAVDTANEIRTLLTDTTNALTTGDLSIVTDLIVDGSFTALALENAPAGGGGGGGSATLENQETIIQHLENIEGDGFDTAMHSLVAVSAAWGAGGSGTVPVNHNTGGANNYTVLDPNGAGIGLVQIIAYVKSEYLAGTFTERGRALTLDDGTWASNMMLNSDVVYILVFSKPGVFGPATAEVDP